MKKTIAAVLALAALMTTTACGAKNPAAVSGKVIPDTGKAEYQVEVTV